MTRDNIDANEANCSSFAHASDAVLDSSQMAALLGCTESTVEEYLRTRRLPGVKFGRGWICTRSALLRVLSDLALQNLTDHQRPQPQAIAQPIPKPKRRRGSPPPLPDLPPEFMATALTTKARGRP